MTTQGDPAPALVGDRYRLGSVIGVGAMAEVFEAVDERLSRPVAVKRMWLDQMGDPDAVRRFENEARSAASLSHPNVVGVLDSGTEADGRPYLVMERLPGTTLADRLAEGSLSESEVLRLAANLLAALAAGERAGLVHRDIKPSNVLVASDGSFKIADFGIAKREKELDLDLTATGLLLGTPAYLAPECLEGSTADARSDLYAVGVILYEALAGRRAFQGATAVAIAQEAMSVGVPRLDRRMASPSTADAVAAATAINPAHRYQSAQNMAAALGVAEPAAGIAAVSVDRTTVMPAFSPPVRTSAWTGLAAVSLSRWDQVARRLKMDRSQLAIAAASVLLVLLLATVGLSWTPSAKADGPVSPSTVPTAQVTTAVTTPPPTAPALPQRSKGHKGHDD